MKNTLIAILVLIILVLGYLFIKAKTSYRSTINEWPETEPATPTNNNSQTNTNNNNSASQNNPTSQTNNILPGYATYQGEAPFTFTYLAELFTPDYYTNEGDKPWGVVALSITSDPSVNGGCDGVSITTKEMNSVPVCRAEISRYSNETINYCRVTVGQKTGTTYKVNASTPQVCGSMPSQTTQDFVDHLISELSKQ